MECCRAQPSSHDGSLHADSRVRSIRGMQLMAAVWDFAEMKALLGNWRDVDIQNQLDRIVRNKTIYQKAATVESGC